jgi:DNA-binding GntR family transcriptional regulator
VNNLSRPKPAQAALFTAIGETSGLATSGLSAQEIEIFRKIHAAIFEQRLRPGTRMTEDDLTGIFKVSRMRVRRILLALAHTGLVSLPRGRGALIASPSVAEAQGLFTARRLIECSIIEKATLAPRQSLQKLRRIIEAEEIAARAHDKIAMLHLSGAFHVELARFFAGPVMAEIVAGLVTRSALIIALFHRAEGHGCRPNDHATLLKALAKSDFSEAVRLMQSHLATIESALNLSPTPTTPQNLRDVFIKPIDHR